MPERRCNRDAAQWDHRPVGKGVLLAQVVLRRGAARLREEADRK